MTNKFADLTNLVEILKTVYGEGITNQFKDEVTTYNQFTKSTREPGGLGYAFAVRWARNQSVGARGEYTKLPAAMTGQKDQGLIKPRYIYGTMKITGPAIETAKRGPEAFVDSLSDELDDIYQSVIVQLNRMSHGDGHGLIGTTTATATPSTSTTWTAVFDTIQYFQVGMLVDFFQSGTADATCCGQRVSAIDPSTNTVTFEASGQTYLSDHPNATIAAYTNTTATVASGSLCVAMGSRLPSWTSADTPVEMYGLEALYDNGTKLSTFENIILASFPMWNANIISNSGVARELDIDLMLQACDLTRTISGRNVDTIRCGLGQRRKYIGLLLPDVRYAPGKLRGGYEEIAFSAGDGRIGIVVDPKTQPGKMYFEPDGVIQKFELTPLGWGDLDGNKMQRTIGYDSWEAFLRIYTNIGTDNQRNALTKIDDLAEPSLFS